MNALAIRIGFLAATWPALALTQTYVGFEPGQLSLDDGPVSPPTITIRKAHGKTVAAPWIADQVGFDSVQISPDHRRIGWIVLKANICCGSPLGLVVFKGDKIERIVEEACIDRWMFGKAGSVIAYWAETCHFSQGPWFVLMDTASGFEIARYAFKYRAEDGFSEKLPEDAPQWVRDLYVSSD